MLNRVGGPRECIGSGFFIAMLRIRTEAGGKSCYLILLQFGDLERLATFLLRVPWHMLHSSMNVHMSQVNVSKVVHKLLEKSSKLPRIIYIINTLTPSLYSFQIMRPQNHSRS